MHLFDASLGIVAPANAPQGGALAYAATDAGSKKGLSPLI
jgi:hypothetical protein